MRTALFTMGLALLVQPTSRGQDPGAVAGDKAFEDAAKLLERAAVSAKDAAERTRLRNAATVLRDMAARPKIQNHLISDFVDSPEKYKGQTLTFQVAYVGDARDPLREKVKRGDDLLFVGVDPRNKTKLILGVVPKLKPGAVVPLAADKEELVVTFQCESGTLDTKGNVATGIRRP